MNIFNRKAETSGVLEVDMHSHLVPGIDDGSQSIEQSIEMLEQMANMGFKKVITTPHIISDIYPNTPEIITREFAKLKEELAKTEIPIEIEVAAEHYLDEFLIGALEKNKILSIKNKYILFETSFMLKPAIFEEFIFQAISRGLKPVLAHPERYLYFQTDWNLVMETLERGVLFQINISSLSGYYSRQAKTLAEKLIEKKHVHFLSTDAHHIDQLRKCEEAMSRKSIQTALKLPLLNSSLL